MRIALIGVSGSGKGTQAKLLAEKYRVSHISTGDLLRDEARDGRLLSDEDKRALDEGRLVSDDVVRQLLEERLRRKDTKRGFVIDGYPRNIPQAQSLDNLLGMLGRPLQIAIYTEMSDELLNKRNVGRQICTGCGEIYNKYFSPPTQADTCDKCGVELGTRKDDTPKAVAERVAVHKQNTMPLITYFRAQHKLRTVGAAGTVEEIHHKICAIVDLEIRPLEIEAVFSAADSSGEEDNTVIAGGQINRIAPTSEPVRSRTSKSRPAAKPTAAKPTKTAAKKTAETKQPAAKKTTAKKTTAKKAVTKKTTAKKAVAKKATTKKATAKKSVTKKATAKKTTAKKTVTKKAAAPKTTAKKTVTKKAAAKKTTTKKATAKKKAAKKTTGKKSAKKVTKKTIAKKAAARKTTAHKTAGKKKTAKASAKKKTAASKAPAAKAKKKTAAKKKKK